MRTFKAKTSFEPLYRQGDEFVILEERNNQDLVPIKALRLRDKSIYYFEKEEIET